jgi:rSAM/selenodomain-associated transferase 2
LPEKISIIIPAWEEQNIERIVQSIGQAPDVELILALATQDKQTPESGFGKIVRSKKGRAIQMNAGAALASGDILLFLHADTFISAESLDNVRQALVPPNVAGGSYRLKLESDNLWLRLVSAVANARTNLLGLPYGDQAIFLRRKTFEEIGGYQIEPILEDMVIVGAIKKLGSLALLDDYAISSARKWISNGMFKNTMRNWAIIGAYLLGVTPEKIDKWLRGY